MTSPVDTLTSKTVKELLFDKYILILGDSVVRGLYKDLIRFLNSDDLLSEDELRIKGEKRFYGDRLVNGGVQKGLTNGTDYEEVREYTAGGRIRMRFYFLTRCYSAYIKDVVFNEIKNQTIKPDIIIMNSCLWDISRYGIYSMRSYQQNLDHIMGSFRQMLPNALFLWLSALPVSNSSKGGVIVPKAEYIRPILPGLIRDGNYHCSQICDNHGILYVDLHTIFSTMLHLRRPDGIHWSAIATRLMNEMVLNHTKAFYHGAKDFKCPTLRTELANKINTYKQRIQRSNQHHSKTDYLSQNLLDNDGDDDNNNDNMHKSLSKRKRTTTNVDGDDEKENDQYHRKVIIRSSTIKNEQRMVIIKKVTNESDIQQEKILEEKIEPEFCDFTYDNEFEGLQLLYFSSYGIEPSDEIEDLPIQQERSFDIDVKPPINSLIAPVSNQQDEEKTMEPDYIILSSDDEDETTTTTEHIVPLSPVLPVYLLNQRQ